MCPIWPLHLIILYILALCPLWVICQTLPSLTATYHPSEVELNMEYTEYVEITVQGTGLEPGDEFLIGPASDHIAVAEWNSTYRITEAEAANNHWEGKVRIIGNFLGRTNVTMTGRRATGMGEFPIVGNLQVTVLRPERVIDTIFVTSVALFMSFGLGFLIFPDSPAMRLGMFFTGVSPGGGASNIWTFILGGNLNLSLAMTSISTLAAFGFMPMWLFSLGQVVFANADIVVPYARIGSFIAGLIVPLAIGLAMQRWTPKLAAFMVRILKGFSTTLLLFIIIFAIVTNLYIFELFTWEIIAAGMGLPWLGYMAGYALARIFRQPHPDALAISIETGVQNTGISIFLLRYALPQPEADLTTVVPVSVAIMTPIPMTCIFIYQKIKACIVNRNQHKKIIEEEGNTTPIPETPEPVVVATIDVGK